MSNRSIRPLQTAFRQCGSKRRRTTGRPYATEATTSQTNSIGTERLHVGQSYGQPMHATHPHLFQNASELTPGIPKAEYESRRRKLMDNLPDNAVVVCCGNRLQYMSQSIFYKFRQSTDFLYLTGFNEPDACVVLQKNSSSRGYKMRFFCRSRDADREKWEGPRTGLDGAVDLFGADEAEDIELLAAFLSSTVASLSGPLYLDLPRDANLRGYNRPKSSARSIIDFFTSGNRSSALGMLSIGRKRVDVDALVGQLTGRNATVSSPLKAEVEKLRLYKSQNELALMRHAAELSSDAHAKAMRFARPGLNESQLVAHFEYHTNLLGSERLAYVPVCASHDSALTIHYTANNRLLQKGSLVLLDAGCEYQGYASDITRTFPVDGKFTAAHGDLYQAVLNATKTCIKLCTERESMSLNDLHRNSTNALRSELRQIGFSSLDNSLMESQLYPHFVSHPLGMDLHDTPSFDRSERLRAGMVVTIEPGIYVPYSNAFPKHFRGLGVRVEDEVAIEKDDYTVLSANCPREVVDIEATCMGALEST